MPVLFSFDIQGADPAEHNRIQSFFERLGWENLGGSSYRYPPLGKRLRTEDWFNRVVPALMLFRSYVIGSKARLKKCSLDVQSSTGYSRDSKYGNLPKGGSSLRFERTGQPAFGESNLREWLDQAPWPY